MRRAEQVISGLPPGPAANAARGLPHRAGRQPEPSPRRAGRLARRRRAHRDSKTVRREPGCARNHQEGHLQRVHRAYRPRNLPNAPSRKPQSSARTECPATHAGTECPAPGNREFSTKWRTKRTARRIRTWRRAVRTNRQRREERDEFGNAPSRTGHQRPTARAGCERNPRTTAPSRTPTTTESAPSSTSRPERHRAQRDSETVRQSAGSPPRRTPRRAHRAYRPQNPRDQPGGGHSLTTTHRVSPVQTAPSAAHAENPPVSITGTAVTVAPATGPDAVLHAYRPVNAPSGTLSRTRRAGTSRRQPDSRAKQRTLPEDAERTTISKRYDGTPTGPGTRRDAHHHEPAERTGPRTFRAHRTHLRSITRADHPGPVGDQRSSPHTQTRITRPDQPAPSVPAPETRPPQKKIGHPGNKRPESGV